MMIFTIQHGEKMGEKASLREIICKNKRRTNGANKILNGTLAAQNGDEDEDLLLL